MKKSIYLVIAMISLALSFQSCEKELFCVDGDGPIVSRTLDLDPFTGINSMGADQVFISQGDEQKVVATGHANIIERLERRVDEGIWDIRLEDDHCYWNYELTIYITVPDIRDIRITGSADIVVNDFEKQEDLYIKITGSGDVELHDFLGCKSLEIDVLGSGDIDCDGTFDSLSELDIKVAGSGNFDGFKAETENCYIEVSGSGNCNVAVLDKLDVEITGSGNIYYRGTPAVYTNITGSGDLVHVN